jgi:hypothetical protein
MKNVTNQLVVVSERFQLENKMIFWNWFIMAIRLPATIEFSSYRSSGIK